MSLNKCTVIEKEFGLLENNLADGEKVGNKAVKEVDAEKVEKKIQKLDVDWFPHKPEIQPVLPMYQASSFFPDDDQLPSHILHPLHFLIINELIKLMRVAILHLVREILSRVKFALVGSCGVAPYLEVFRPETRVTTAYNIPYTITIPHELIASDASWIVLCETQRTTFLRMISNQFIHIDPPPIGNLERMLYHGELLGCFIGTPVGDDTRLIIFCPNFGHPYVYHWCQRRNWTVHMPILEGWNSPATTLAIRGSIIYVSTLAYGVVYMIQMGEIDQEPLTLVTIRRVEIIHHIAHDTRIANIVSLAHEGDDLYLIFVYLTHEGEFEDDEVVLHVCRISENGVLTVVQNTEDWMSSRHMHIIHGRRGHIIPAAAGRILCGGRTMEGIGFLDLECCELIDFRETRILKRCSGSDVCRCDFAWVAI